MKDRGSDFAPIHIQGIGIELSDETLVYDEEKAKAHCLNRTAAEVWNLCDGKKTVAEIANVLAKESKSPVGEQMVWMALTRFAKNGLLLNGTELPSIARVLSRRNAVRRVGVAAVAMALPVVTSILVPTPAAAVSCVPLGGSCATKPCCTGLICVPLTHLCA